MGMRKGIQRFVWRHGVLRERPGLRDALEQFTRSQVLPPDELAEMAWQKLVRIVSHAYENVPYYRRRYSEAGFHPGQLKEPSDVVRVPIISREDLRENLSDMVADGVDAGRLHLRTTAGSTGMPVRSYHDPKIDVLIEAMQARVLGWWGICPWTDSASVYRRPTGKKEGGGRRRHGRGGLRGAWRALRKLSIMRLCRPSWFLLDAGNMDPPSMEEFIRKIRQTRPGFIMGYVGAMDVLASHMAKRGHSAGLPTDAVWVTAAALTQSQRLHMESVFGCPVYDQYGCSEAYWLAAECTAQAGLHVMSDCRHVEVLDDEGRPAPPGVPGRVVITDLEDYSAPIIRYENGDVATRKEGTCPCGLTLPLMGSIEGRITENIVLKDGTVIIGYCIGAVLGTRVDHVRNYQLHQDAIDHMTVRIAPTAGADVRAVLPDIQREFADKVKGLMRLDYEIVDSIDYGRGKPRRIICDVAPQGGP